MATFVYPEYAAAVFDGGDIRLIFKHTDDCGLARIILSHDDAVCLLGQIEAAIFASRDLLEAARAE